MKKVCRRSMGTYLLAGGTGSTGGAMRSGAGCSGMCNRDGCSGTPGYAMEHFIQEMLYMPIFSPFSGKGCSKLELVEVAA